MSNIPLIGVIPSQPYRFEWGGASSFDDANPRLAELWENTDKSFQTLFDNLKNLIGTTNTVITVVNGLNPTTAQIILDAAQGPEGETGLPGPIGPVGPQGLQGFTIRGDDGQDGEPLIGAGLSVSPGAGSCGFTQGSVIFGGPSGQLAQDNAKFFWDDTNFRLGIGTATPNVPLEIAQTGNGTILEMIRLSNPGVGDGAGTYISFNGLARIEQNLDSGAHSSLRFYTYNNSGLAEAMRIDPTGKVGIGTTGPSTLLEVNGAVTFDSTLNVAGLSTLAAANLSGLLTVTDAADPAILIQAAGSGAHRSIRIQNTSSDGYSTLWMGGSNDGFIRGGSAAAAFAGELAFLTSGANKLTFYSNNTLALTLGTDQSLTATGNCKFATTQNFSWVSKSVDTVYQAASDGLVLFSVEVTSTNNGRWVGFSDSSNPPTTQRTNAGATITVAGQTHDLSFTMPVRKGDYYKVLTNASTGAPSPVVYWAPLGTAG